MAEKKQQNNKKHGRNKLRQNDVRTYIFQLRIILTPKLEKDNNKQNC